MAPLLLELHGGAGLLELVPEGFGVFPGEAFLNGVRCVVHERLRLLQAKTGRGADLLDDLYLLVARRLKHHVELGLLLFGSRRAVTGWGACRWSCRKRRRRDSKLLLEH